MNYKRILACSSLALVMILSVPILSKLWFTKVTFNSSFGEGVCTQLGTPSANACGGREYREFSIGTFGFLISCSVDGRVKEDGSANYSKCYPTLR